jgi:hypothetical protein
MPPDRGEKQLLVYRDFQYGLCDKMAGFQAMAGFKFKYRGSFSLIIYENLRIFPIYTGRIVI